MLIMFYATASGRWEHDNRRSGAGQRLHAAAVYPLNFLGMVYRQIKYSLADMDLIFKLLERKPEIQDKPDARELQLERARSDLKGGVRLSGGPRFCGRSILPCGRERRWRW